MDKSNEEGSNGRYDGFLGYVSCTTFNILAPIYKRLSGKKCESEYPELWLSRNDSILNRLLELKSSIISLQEFWVGNEELVRIYEKRLGDAGYKTYILARPNNRGDECCRSYPPPQSFREWHVLYCAVAELLLEIAIQGQCLAREFVNYILLETKRENRRMSRLKIEWSWHHQMITSVLIQKQQTIPQILHKSIMINLSKRIYSETGAWFIY